MRFVYIVLFITLIGCDDPPHAGEEGYPCASWIPCHSNENGEYVLECVDGICVHCGDEDEPCCEVPGGSPICNTNAACVDGIEDHKNCSGSCGVIGLACCEESAGGCSEGTCNDAGMCEEPISDPCQGGSTEHVMYFIDSLCGSQQVTFWTNTAAEAEDCRQAYVAAAGPQVEVCPLDTVPTVSHVCKNGESFGMHLNHCSAQQLTTCETNWEPTSVWGPCP